MACNGCNIMAQLTLRDPTLVGARRRMSEGSRVVRHEILALSTGVLRTLDIASVPIAGLIAYSLRFQSLAIEFQHGLIVILGMVVVANVMAIIDAYNLADIHVWHRQAAKVTNIRVFGSAPGSCWARRSRVRRAAASPPISLVAAGRALFPSMSRSSAASHLRRK